MHVFVTGASGFIGSAVVPELIGAGQALEPTSTLPVCKNLAAMEVDPFSNQAEWPWFEGTR